MTENTTNQKESKMIDNFTHKYPVIKTLKNRLKPIEKKQENLEKKIQDEKNLIEKEIQLNENVKFTKDETMNYLINANEQALLEGSINLEDLRNYRELYNNPKRNEKPKKNKKSNKNEEPSVGESFKECEKRLREEVFGIIEPVKNKLNGDFLKNTLPNSLDNEEDKEKVLSLSKYTTFFQGFYKNCKNMYLVDEKSTAIPDRCINVNLPKHMDNIAIYQKLDSDILKQIRDDFEGINNTSVDDVFTLEYFNNLLPQSGIDNYNKIVGEFNQQISIYNQKNENDKIPSMIPLYNQIGNSRNRRSKVSLTFKDDKELLSSVKDYFTLNVEDQNIQSYFSTIEKIEDIIANLEKYNPEGIYVKNNSNLTYLSNGIFGDWSMFEQLWKDNYDSKEENKKRKNNKNYEKTREKAYNDIESFSLFELQELINNSSEEYIKDISLIGYYKKEFESLCKNVSEKYKETEDFLNCEYEGTLKTDDENSAKVKTLLDSVKKVESFLKNLLGTGSEYNKDRLFYGDFEIQIQHILTLDELYKKAHNYITAKPYSQNKIKLSFGNPNFLKGWAKDSEVAHSAQLFIKDGNYFLGVMNKDTKNEFNKEYNVPKDENDVITKVEYEQIKNPSRVIQNLMVIDGETVNKTGRKNEQGINDVLEQLKNTYLPKKINEIRKKGSYKTTSSNFKKEDLVSFLSYYRDRINEYYDKYGFVFKPIEKYDSYNDFADDIERQAYQIKKVAVSYSQIMQLVKEGKLYLFQIYNKDFSKHRKGKKNLNTMYFEMLFDERNLKNVVYKLLGGAEIFYRPASAKKLYKTVIDEKSSYTKKAFVMTKDKRYTENQYFLHLSTEINSSAKTDNLNAEVRQAIKDAGGTNIIGIDRGERNLIYITVIGKDGKIIEQRSLNIIGNTNYQEKLSKRAQDRQTARKNWKTIESIKELKEGYLIQAIHEICQLVVKYDAIIVMEDLNSKFKRNRTKFEKQVYQKFENMLIRKLHYYVDKNITDYNACGGLLNGYQLTDEVGNEKNNQNGIVFFVYPAYTSKIDPTTGFVDLINLNYQKRKQPKKCFESIDDIRYNFEEDYFEFDIDFSQTPGSLKGSKSKWTVCSYGERVEWNSFDKSRKVVNLSESIKTLLSSSNIDYEKGKIKEQLLQMDDKKTQREFLKLLQLTLQMRNTVGDKDYIISPVKNSKGEFYCSDDYKNMDNPPLPQDADANGAYNIARKGLILVNRIINNNSSKYISDKEWFEFAQNDKIL